MPVFAVSVVPVNIIGALTTKLVMFGNFMILPDAYVFVMPTLETVVESYDAVHTKM